MIWRSMDDVLREASHAEAEALARYDRPLLPVDEVVRLGIEIPLDVLNATEKASYRSGEWLR